MKGSTEDPFVLWVPRWVEDLANKEGTTCQDKADEMFTVAVRVEIVESL